MRKWLLFAVSVFCWAPFASALASDDICPRAETTIDAVSPPGRNERELSSLESLSRLSLNTSIDMRLREIAIMKSEEIERASRPPRITGKLIYNRQRIAILTYNFLLTPFLLFNNCQPNSNQPAPQPILRPELRAQTLIDRYNALLNGTDEPAIVDQLINGLPNLTKVLIGGDPPRMARADVGNHVMRVATRHAQTNDRSVAGRVVEMTASYIFDFDEMVSAERRAKELEQLVSWLWSTAIDHDAKVWLTVHKLRNLTKMLAPAHADRIGERLNALVRGASR